MKLLPLVVVSLAAGLGLGVALAYYEVGEVEPALLPPPMEGDATVLSPGQGPQAAPQAIPEATVDNPTHDFGTMQRGTTETHDFLFTNTGTAPLRLKVGRTSCKCTLGEVENRPLAPGESTDVQLEWVAKNPAGSFRQTATVETNDPRRPRVELTVEGLITEVTGVKPGEFLLGRFNADKTGEATVYVAAYPVDDGSADPAAEKTPLVVTARMSESVRSPEKFDLVVEPVPVDELPIERADQGVKITLRAGPGLPLGHVAEWITVETNLDSKGRPTADQQAEGTTLQIPALGRVEGDISLHGSGWSKPLGLLSLGKVASSDGKESKLLVSFKGEHAADSRVVEVESVDPEWLEVELGEPREVREGVTHQPMTVRVPPGQASVIRSGQGEENGGQGAGDARIRLRTNHPTTSELDVKVRFVIAES